MKKETPFKYIFLLTLVLLSHVEGRDCDNPTDYTRPRYSRSAKTLFYQNKAPCPIYTKDIPSGGPLIPKIIHQIWLGGKLPEKFVWMTESWRKKHPTWKYILWTDKDIEELHLINQKQFDEATNFGVKADILRYEILEKYGGVYVDIDYECLKNLDQLHYNTEFYCCYIDDNAISNAFIGCKAHHPLLQICVKRIIHTNAKITDFDDIMDSFGPWFFTRCVLDYWMLTADKSMRMYEPQFSFPMPSGRRFDYWSGKISNSELEIYRNSPSFALHYWATSWQN